MQLLEKYKFFIFIALNIFFIILSLSFKANIHSGYYSGIYILLLGIFLAVFYKSNAKQTVSASYFVWGQELKRKTRLAEYLFLLIGGFLIVVGLKTLFGM